MKMITETTFVEMSVDNLYHKKYSNKIDRAYCAKYDWKLPSGAMAIRS